MKISILHPSRSRPAQAAATAKAWLSSAKYPEDIQYLIGIDADDPKRNEYERLIHQNEVLSGMGIGFTFGENKNAIEAVNRTAKYAEGDLLIQASDDFNQPPFHWDAYLIEQLQGKSDYVVKTQDGLQRTLVTLPIMDRVYYERYGYIYHPDYSHMYSDQELTAVAHMTGKIIELSIRIPHNHYSTGRTVKDAVNQKADSTYGTGAQVFERRKSRNFDIPFQDIVKPYSSIVWH